MENENRTLILSITALSVAAILLVSFVWPGTSRLSFASNDSNLFDEKLVEGVYLKVSPAVVEVYSDRKAGDSFSEVTSGSGFLIDKEGYIVTNNHVVNGADRVRISLFDNRNTEAVVQGRSIANDLALLKVDPALVADIKPVELGDSSEVIPGQMAIIIGSPFGLKNSVSVGVSSGVNRALPSSLGRFIPGMLQTDALISPGNSGGPMLNSAGHVIGITTAIELSSSQIHQRIGFAVPVNILREILPQLKEPGIVSPPWLGTLSQSVSPLLMERLGLTTEQGFYVVRVAPGSPAEQAGLVASGVDSEGRAADGGDIIVAVDGVPVATGTDLTSQLNHHRPGDEVVLTVVRDGTETELKVTLGEWPKG